MPPVSELARVAVVPFWMFAESVMSTTTVITSPTCDARWSLKNAREPLRHSEFDSAGAGWPAGIGMVNGRQSAALVGSAVGVNAGGRPISDRRDSAPQPLSVRANDSGASSSRKRRSIPRAVSCRRARGLAG